MPTLRNKTSNRKSGIIWIIMVPLFVLLLAGGAQLDIQTGFLVPFTLQTLALGVFYYYLPRNYRLLAISLYLITGIAGLPVFSGGKSGFEHFSGMHLGFFIGFVLVAFVKTPQSQLFSHIFGYFIQIHFLIILSGFIYILAKGESIQNIIDMIIGLAPGIVLKSLAGAGIVVLINRYLSLNSSNTR